MTAARHGVVFCVALALGTISAQYSVYAQSADLVLCDRVAADPEDTDKPADVKGVASIAASDVAIAIKFCKTASVSSRRAMYQLGRAYLANKQMNEAAATYRKAADKGSTTAMVELGVMLANGARASPRMRALLANCLSAPDKRAIHAALPILRCCRNEAEERPWTRSSRAPY